MKKLLLLFCLFAAPLHAQTIPPDFHSWFLEQVAGKPFGQQTLLNLEPLLPCVGSQLTPPNAVGERTKIWDPVSSQWTRVGFGEGQWVWVGQGVTSPPIPQSCSASPPPAPVTPVPTLDLSAVSARLDFIIAGQQQDREARERIFANETQQITNLSAQLQAHDEKVNVFVRAVSNRYVQLGLAIFGTYEAQRMTTK